MNRNVLRPSLLCAGVLCLLAACAPAPVTPQPSVTPPPVTATAPPTSPTVVPTTVPTAIPSTETTAPPIATEEPTLKPGASVELVFDTALGQVVLVNGGPESGKPASDPVELWTWEGERWSLLAAAEDGPRWRHGASVVYDVARQQLLLFGGSQGRRQMHDMWLWDGAAWTEYTGELPPYTSFTGIAYDAGRERVVLFGGTDARYNLLNETWEWDGQAWTLVSTEGPAPRFPGAMTYDAGRGEVLVYGGHSPSGNDSRNWGDTWGWDGATWHEYTVPEPTPGIRPATRAAYDGNLNAVLLFGGTPDNDTGYPVGGTWAWDGAVWTYLDAPGPSQREWLAMTYDPVREVVVLFGGFEAPPYLGTPPNTDTWEWDGTAWTCVGGCDRP